MLKETLYSSGKNRFEGDRFSDKEWSAPTMVDAPEIRARIESFRLEGRVIRSMKLVGSAIFHTREMLEDTVYGALEQEGITDEEELRERSRYEAIGPDRLFARACATGAPLLISFEDYDRFEIDMPQAGEYRLGMNCIPWSVQPERQLQNVDANVLFKPCLGKRIEKAEVCAYVTDKDPMTGDHYMLYQDDRPGTRELVSRIVLHLEDGIRFVMETCLADSNSFFCEDAEGKNLTIPFRELKKGLYNWEDLHLDPDSGFMAESTTVFFGEQGRKWVDGDTISFIPEDGRSRLMIQSDDFHLLYWALSWQVRDWFDEMDDYVFPWEEWQEILNKADRLAAFETFDELFDFLTGLGITYGHGEDVFLYTLTNACGREYWENRREIRKQVRNLRRWTEMVVPKGMNMLVHGY